MADNWLSSQPSYEGIAGALRKKLDEDEVARQRQIQQAIGVRGIRTSGIGMYPTQEAGRIRGSEEAGIYSAVGGQQLGNIFQSGENEKNRALELKLQEMRNNAASEAARKAKKNSWASALWSIPLGLATGGASTALTGLIEKWMAPKTEPL